MKRIILLVFVLLNLTAISQNMTEIVWNEMTKGKEVELIMQSDSSLQLNNFPFKVHFENKSDRPTKFTYEQSGDSISFVPYGVKLRGTNTFFPVGKVRTANQGKKDGISSVLYEGIFAPGISIINEVAKTGFRKIVKIDNDKVFGRLSNKTDSVELIFEVQDLISDSLKWDKNSMYTFKTAQRLNELSTLEAVSIWDADTSIIVPAKFYKENGKMYFAKVIPVSFLKADRPIYTDVTITYGSKYVFNSTSLSAPEIAILSDTKFVIAYGVLVSPTSGSAIVGTVSGTTISYGTAVKYYTTSNTTNVNITAMSSDTIMIAYIEGASNYGSAVVGVVSGTSITFGTPVRFTSSAISATQLAIDKIRNNTAVITYRGTTTFYGYSIIATKSGLSLSYGSAYNFNTTASTNYMHTKTLDTDKFVTVYVDAANSNRGTAIIGTVSGTTISYGSEYVFNTGSTLYTNVSVFGPSKFICSYTDVTALGNYGNSVIGEVSGTTISYGSEYSFNAANTRNARVTCNSQDRVVIAYDDVANSDYGTAIVGEVSGTVITYGSEYVFNQAQTNTPAINNLSGTSVVIAFIDAGYSATNGNAIIGTLPSQGKKINGITYVKWNNATITKWNNQ